MDEALEFKEVLQAGKAYVRSTSLAIAPVLRRLLCGNHWQCCFGL